MKVELQKVLPLSMIDIEGNQRIDLKCYTSENAHLFFKIFEGKKCLRETPLNLSSGYTELRLMLPTIDKDFLAKCCIFDKTGNLLSSITVEWQKPIKRTLYVMISSHTDIGLHNSQYIQRKNSEEFLDLAQKLCDETEGADEKDRYRYTMEGTWFWENYPADRGEEAAQNVVENYIKKGKIGLCGGLAGNHTHVYGFEEMCRSAYTRVKMQDDWGVETHTMSMIDNNGLCWSMIQPYAEAGIENIIFSPNQWNPLPSTIWYMDKRVGGYQWNSSAGGGGARIDVRYDSELPMLFWWEANDGQSRMLVWSSLQYDNGGQDFGCSHRSAPTKETYERMEERVAIQLEKLDKKYPYDIWLYEDYGDDQIPNLNLLNCMKLWNSRWQYPKFRALGNPNEPFEYVRKKYADNIPVLRGDITGGWYQHPVATAELLANKFEADRSLATAEKFASFAALINNKYEYPTQSFERAWQYLLMNDEHSYGTSGYEGRRVFETWLQHRDWIEKAQTVAKDETEKAVTAICETISSEKGIVVLNPTALNRTERIEFDGKEAIVQDVPPFAYKFIPEKELKKVEIRRRQENGTPIVENRYYRIVFKKNGAISSIFDKELKRELLDSNVGYGANAFVYTNDNHRTYYLPNEAQFTIEESNTGKITVIAKTQEDISGAAIVQKVTIDETYKRIDIDNKIEHLRDMFNNSRWNRYLYYAFPFAVENAFRYLQLNGCEMEYAKDITGHGTDVYAASHEWCCVENEEFGIGLIQRDTQLIEYDHIHPDKTDIGDVGNGSAVYSYVANDWLQRHVAGGSHLNLRIRYAITSYSGNHQKAKLAQEAEKFVTPVVVKRTEPYTSNTPEIPQLEITEKQRFINMKRSKDGKGLIIRLYGDLETAYATLKGYESKRVAVDETELNPLKVSYKGLGFTTWRVGAEKISLQEEIPMKDIIDENVPAPIGSCYTGLITEPRAICGEKRGQLYLLWGANMEKNLAYYEVYRSETAAFLPNEETLIAKVKPEEFRVGRYEDVGLKDHTSYFYTVRAINSKGKAGEYSKIFEGITRELIDGQDQKLRDLER